MGLCVYNVVCVCVWCVSVQSCPTLCDPIDYSMPSSSFHGISPHKNIGVDCHFLLHSGTLMTEIFDLFFKIFLQFSKTVTLFFLLNICCSNWVIYVYLSSSFLILFSIFFNSVPFHCWIQLLNFYNFFQALLKYNWHITLCKFKVWWILYFCYCIFKL